MVAVAIPQSTAQTQLDAAVARVKEGSHKFVKLSIDERIRLAEEMLHGYYQVAEESVIAACHAKGIDPNSALAGEEWLAGPMVTVRLLRLTVEALRDIKAKGAPHIEKSWLRTLSDGRTAVKVFPTNSLDAMLLSKHVGEMYLQPGINAENLHEHQAVFYKKPHDGRLCLVLGAGNVNAIPPTDCITKLFNEGTVCVLKMNPVNAYVGPFIERAFKSAIDKGFLAVVYGGAEEGSYLVNHPLVDEIHITGSDKTHDMMVWGPPGSERDARKARNEPLLKKAISSELGNITPVIVIPGPYDQGELDFQAHNIAGMVANNASFNCNSAKLLVTPQQWEARDALISKIEQGLGRAAVRKAYYPGAEERWKRFVDGRQHVKLVGNPQPGELAYALIQNVDHTRHDDFIFNTEPWCTVLSEMPLPSENPIAYLENAVKFVNEKVWGTLAATLIVHPKSLKDPQFAAAYEKALRDLRYGSVTINTWAGAVFGIGTTAWGGHPSSQLHDIQSGRGWVHNSLMIEGIEKVTLTAPVKAFPVSPWFPGHRSVHTLARRLTDFEYNPSWLKIPGVAAAGLRA